MKTNLLMCVLLTTAAMPVAAADDSSSMLNDSSYHSLVSATKALRVGDVLTVVVQESASAASSTDLHGSRNFSVNGQVTYGKAGTHAAAAGTGSSSDGTGTTERSGQLLAQVSVRVNGINTNGDLVVAGQQSLKINGEEQRISLSGVVRPRDVGDDNTVLSSRIAEVRIRFDGAGFVSDQSKPGWLARFFNLLGM